jgi:hypothetical protein
MKKSKALNIITLIDESRYAHGKLAVNENCLKLKFALENLGFRVLSFQKGLPDEEVNKLLIKEKVNFFLTLDCDDFLCFLDKHQVLIIVSCVLVSRCWQTLNKLLKLLKVLLCTTLNWTVFQDFLILTDNI